MNLPCPATSFHVEEYVTSMLWTSHERPQQEQNQKPGVNRWKKPVEETIVDKVSIDLSQMHKKNNGSSDFHNFCCSACGRGGLIQVVGYQFQDVPSLGDSALHPST